MNSPALLPAEPRRGHPTPEDLRDFLGELHADFVAAAKSSDTRAALAFSEAAEHCGGAFGSLAALYPRAQMPAMRDNEPAPPRTGEALAIDARDGLQLALAVLENDHVELTPFDVLAITRTVTSLCASLANLQEMAR